MINWLKSREDLKAEINSLKDKVVHLEERLESHQSREKGRQLELNEKKAQLESARRDRDDYKAKYNEAVKKLRQQTDADLFLTAEKIKQKILKGETPSKEDRGQLDRLIERQRQLANIQYVPMYGSNPWRNLGISGGLGGLI